MSHLSPQIIMHRLDEKLALALAEMRMLPAWRALVAEGGVSDRLPPLLEQMAEQAEVCAAEVNRLLCNHLAKLPASRPTQMLMSLFDCHSYSDQVTNGKVVAGNAANEVIEQWKRVLAIGDPFAVMGACYLWKAVWPRLIKEMDRDLKALNLRATVREAMAKREKVDRKNTALLRALIEDIQEQYPQTESSFVAGFEALLQGYPLRFWRALLQGADLVAQWQDEGKECMRVG